MLPFSVTAFGIFLCRQAFMSIPLALEEAARIDGAGALRIWWHVMLPLARPALATLAVFSVIGAWSNLLWPLIVLQEQSRFTLPVAINQLLGVFATERPLCLRRLGAGDRTGAGVLPAGPAVADPWPVGRRGERLRRRLMDDGPHEFMCIRMIRYRMQRCCMIRNHAEVTGKH